MLEGFDWLRAALTIGFGALAGGLTNRVAIWMLFHPYEPPRLLGRRLTWLQGAMPKNQGRLARSVGGAVGGRLLTPADLAAELQDPELRAAFGSRLRELVVGLVREEAPALVDLLPEPAVGELREFLHGLLEEVRGHLVRTFEAPAFTDEAERMLAELVKALREEPVGDALDPERLEALRDRADAWLGRIVGSEAFERTARRHVQEAAEHVLRPGRTLEELIPTGVVAAIEHAINDYLPLAMERLGRLLEDPRARERVEGTVHQLLDRFMRDLRFHQRVVAKLIITEETVDRVLRTLEAEGADQLAALLREAEVQDAMARSVNEGIVEFLRRPSASVFGRIHDPQVQSALDAIAAWLVRAARDPGPRRFLLEQAEEAVWKVGERSWADLAALVPADRLGPWVATALRSEPGRALYETLGDDLIERALERPLGGLSRFVREEAAVRVADALAEPAWSWIAAQVPEVAERVRVADRVEEKIRDYPLSEFEALIRSVTERELDLIVRLGYVLGAVIGTILVGVSWLLP